MKNLDFAGVPVCLERDPVPLSSGKMKTWLTLVGQSTSIKILASSSAVEDVSASLMPLARGLEQLLSLEFLVDRAFEWAKFSQASIYQLPLALKALGRHLDAASYMVEVEEYLSEHQPQILPLYQEFGKLI